MGLKVQGLESMDAATTNRIRTMIKNRQAFMLTSLRRKSPHRVLSGLGWRTLCAQRRLPHAGQGTGNSIRTRLALFLCSHVLMYIGQVGLTEGPCLELARDVLAEMQTVQRNSMEGWRNPQTRLKSLLMSYDKT